MARRQAGVAQGRNVLLGGLLVLVVLVVLALLYLPTSLAIQKEFKNCMAGYEEGGHRVLAFKTNDLAECELTADPEYCRAVVQLDDTYCERLAYPDDVECRLLFGDEFALSDCPFSQGYCIALISRNEADCETEECRAFIALDETWFFSEAHQQECMDKAYLRVALAKDKAELCEKIQDPVKKEQCG